MRKLRNPPARYLSSGMILLQRKKKMGKSPRSSSLPSVSTKTTNSDCKDLASNSDFLKIRKRMAAEKDNDAMVLAAKRFFKTKCFSTEQIRNLSFLFLSDEGRYMFFDAAYPIPLIQKDILH